ncbi:MAG: BolA/IbaG family iron-sulfur metabolism protein, partial [Myxococcales bacterium]|nr:BolA/IbaG family iron-sulfur metabolism protein [Myxococcales bacterium]
MIEPHLVEERLRAGLPEISHLELKDMTGTKDHYEAVIVAACFEGKSRVDQQRMVFAALGELMFFFNDAPTTEIYTPGRNVRRMFSKHFLPP